MIKKLDNGIKWFLYIILGWIICYLFLLSIFGTTAMGPAELVIGVENSGEHAYYLPDIWGLQVFLLVCCTCRPICIPPVCSASHSYRSKMD